jgi:hypothetical protein
MDASVQINVTLVGPIAIHSGIWQGCPLSMWLYAMCLHPLVRSLEESLSGIKIGRRHPKTTVIAYANDVSIFVTEPTTFTTIRHAISTYEKATGARLNPLKSNAMAIAGWAVPQPHRTTFSVTVLISYVSNLVPPSHSPELTAGRKSFERYVSRQGNRLQERCSWNKGNNMSRSVSWKNFGSLRKYYCRHGYIPNSSPPPAGCTYGRHQSSMGPITTLQRTKHEGGWNLPNIELKCRTCSTTASRSSEPRTEQG